MQAQGSLVHYVTACATCPGLIMTQCTHFQHLHLFTNGKGFKTTIGEQQTHTQRCKHKRNVLIPWMGPD